MKKGTVYWITGLAGSGKTTLGKLLCADLQQKGQNPVIHLDGDELREVYGETDGAYELAHRKITAMRNSRLCQLLANQGVDVVCSTVSLFWECQNWNRKNIQNYKEIFLKAPLSILKNRREIYQKLEKGPVVGREITPEEPKQPDIILESDGTVSATELLATLKTNLEIV